MAAPAPVAGFGAGEVSSWVSSGTMHFTHEISVLKDSDTLKPTCPKPPPRPYECFSCFPDGVLQTNAISKCFSFSRSQFRVVKTYACPNSIYPTV